MQECNRLQNPLVWKAAALVGTRNRDADNHAGFHGVLTHENGIHLYKSPDAKYVVMRQMTDYFAAAFLLNLVGGSWISALPLTLAAVQMPRKISVVRYFCWHAELLPHTEQVVFHKATMFGAVERFYVDIQNLEKVDAAEVNAPLMWDINMFDPDMCFRCAATGEVFVFDKQGQWN